MTTRRRIGILSTVILLAAAGVPAVAQTWGEAVAAFGRQDYGTAYSGFRSHAEEGNPYAQTYVGLMYYDGHGAPQDYTEAIKWYRRAAEQGDANAQLLLGIMYYNGDGVPQDYVRTHKWYNLAASRLLESYSRAIAVD